MLIPQTLPPIGNIPRLKSNNRKRLLLLPGNPMTTLLHSLNPLLQSLYFAYIMTPRQQEREKEQSDDCEDLRFRTVKEGAEGVL
jgi:hypothetical protein